MTDRRTHELYAAIASEERVRDWERRRDEALRIKCPRVAAKFQRWIDKEKRESPPETGETRLSAKPHDT